MSCKCDPKTICKKVCQRSFNGWINSPEISLKVKDGKKATLTFTDVRKFSLYQVYNEFNKKLNCDRKVLVINPENYNKILKKFSKRTCYLEFEPKPEIGKHSQVAFNLCSSQYNEKTNNIILEVVVDKFYIDGVLKPIQDINGIYCMCNLDPPPGATKKRSSSCTTEDLKNGCTNITVGYTPYKKNKVKYCYCQS
jgi:hypothetical protein